jgi:Cellulose binding domain
MFDVVVFTALRGHRARAVIAAGAVVVVASAIVVAVTWSSAPGGGSCSAAYSVSKQWVTGFTASIKVTGGSSAIRSWTLRYTYAGGERLAMGWDGNWSQSGDTVTVSNASWNGSLAPGSYARIRAKFDNQGTSSVPSAISCTGTSAGAQAAPSVSVSAPAPSASSSQSPGASAGTTSQALTNSAVTGPLIAFKAPSASDHRPGTSPTAIREAAALYYLALVSHEDRSATADDGTTVESALLAQVGHLIAGGNEPDADGGLEGWSHALVADALVLLKNGPAWSQLPAGEQAKVTLLMEALGYAGNYTYNDANNFSSGLCGYGNFSKTNNPNYQDGYVGVELAAIQYFGASAWDRMLTGFNDAAFIARLRAAGFTNAARCYSAAGSAATAAIARPFVWKGHPASDLMGIWNQLAADTFDRTVVSSVAGVSQGAAVTAHIADGTTSPEEGKCCMGHEFDSNDSSGLRSSALYVFEGWMNVTASRVVLSVLGGFDCAAATSGAQYEVGSEDLIYKLRHGYISYALNQNGIMVNDSGEPSSDGPLAKGYAYDLDAYNALAGPRSC